jgi:hypothetical protein
MNISHLAALLSRRISLWAAGFLLLNRTELLPTELIPLSQVALFTNLNCVPVNGSRPLDVVPELSLARTTNGQVCLDYSSTPGQTNWISASDNLTDWIPLGVAVTEANGRFEFQDGDSRLKQHRFYRVSSDINSPLGVQSQLLFGLFVCWSNSSFTGRTTEEDGDWADWPAPYQTPDQSSEVYFNPPGLEEADVATLQRTVTDPWAELASQAGMTHLLLCVKHVEGFCLWASAASPDFCITCAKRQESHILHADLVKAVANSCAAKGLRLGFYYCLADRHNGWNTEQSNAPMMVKRHLAELLSGVYGAIDYLFLDIGYGGQDLDPVDQLKYYVINSQRQDLIDFVHGTGLDPNGSGLRRLGHPNTLVGFNDPVLSSPGDYAAVENGHPRPNTPKLIEFSFPLLRGPSGRWFYSTSDQDNRCMSVDDLRDFYDRALDQRNIFDLTVGPDPAGQIRPIDARTIQALARSLANDSPVAPNHFLINNTGARINGCPNGTISYRPAEAWAYQRFRAVGDYSADAHVTLAAGASCQYEFAGTAVEFIAGKSSHPGTVDIYVDDRLQTPPEGLDLHPQLFTQGQVAFAIAALPFGTHILRIVSRISGAEVVVDAFRVYAGVPRNLSVDCSGFVWVVDSEHLIWRYGPWLTNSLRTWVRMPGTARDIGCADSVWKIGTTVPLPSDFPDDFSIACWFGFDGEWRTFVAGEATRIDVAADGTVWTVNAAGQAGRFTDAFDPYSWMPAESTHPAVDIGCRPTGDPAVWKTGPDCPMATWSLGSWEDSPSGSGTRIDLDWNGDVWLVSNAGNLWKSHDAEWSWIASAVLDVGCGANGDVWYLSTDGSLRQVPSPAAW